jgi:hypothetical protein
VGAVALIPEIVTAAHRISILAQSKGSKTVYSALILQSLSTRPLS